MKIEKVKFVTSSTSTTPTLLLNLLPRTPWWIKAVSLVFVPIPTNSQLCTKMIVYTFFFFFFEDLCIPFKCVLELDVCLIFFKYIIKLYINFKKNTCNYIS
jgi:hypothetical protein